MANIEDITKELSTISREIEAGSKFERDLRNVARLTDRLDKLDDFLKKNRGEIARYPDMWGVSNKIQGLTQALRNSLEDLQEGVKDGEPEEEEGSQGPHKDQHYW